MNLIPIVWFALSLYRRVSHAPVQRVSGPVRVCRFGSISLSPYRIAAWGCKGPSPLRSATPCPIAFPWLPLDTSRATDARKSSLSRWGKGFTPAPLPAVGLNRPRPPLRRDGGGKLLRSDETVILLRLVFDLVTAGLFIDRFGFGTARARRCFRRVSFEALLFLSPFDHGCSKFACRFATTHSSRVQRARSQTRRERRTSNPYGSALRSPRGGLTRHRGDRCVPLVGTHRATRPVFRRAAFPESGSVRIRLANPSLRARLLFRPWREPDFSFAFESFESFHARRFACRRQGDDARPMVWVISFPPQCMDTIAKKNKAVPSAFRKAEAQATVTPDAVNGPVKVFRLDDVSVSLFARERSFQGRPATFLSASFSRSYKDAAGERKYTKNFDADDLGKVAELCKMAADHIDGLRHPELADLATH